MQDADVDYLKILARSTVPDHLRSKLDPLDLVQEAALRVHRANGDFTGRSEPEKQVYLRRVFESALTDSIRRYGRSKRAAAKECSLQQPRNPEAAPLTEVLSTDWTSPSQHAMRDELYGSLTSSLSSLPPMQRRVIELHHLGGMSLNETAETLGVTKHSVAGLLRRGLQELRKRLVEERR